MSIPAELKYTKDHEWVRVEGEFAVVGITHHAQEELSDVVYVELPEQGQNAEEGDTVAVVESVKAASDIYAPLSGEIVEVNAELEEDSSLVNSSPYESGWIFKLKLSDIGQLENLLTADGYGDFVG